VACWRTGWRLCLMTPGGERAVHRDVDAQPHPRRAFAPPHAPDPNTVLFVGSMGYPPNIDAIEWLVADISSRIVAARPDARLVAAGRANDDRRSSACATCSRSARARRRRHPQRVLVLRRVDRHAPRRWAQEQGDPAMARHAGRGDHSRAGGPAPGTASTSCSRTMRPARRRGHPRRPTRLGAVRARLRRRVSSGGSWTRSSAGAPRSSTTRAGSINDGSASRSCDPRPRRCVSFAGGGTDVLRTPLFGGAVLSCTIDLYVRNR
jgi:hypothetical protein